MTTAALEKEKPEKKDEKRRALGRGLESLLPGPRVVMTPPIHAAADPVRPPEPAHHAPTEVIPIAAQAETQNGVQKDDTRDVVTTLALDSIDKNPYQTRQLFDEASLIELRDSIQEHGVVQPVVVRPSEDAGRYILVLGERRLRASQMAGKQAVPALIRRLSPQQAAEMTVLENIVREDLTCLEQAQAFKVLSQEFHLTQAQIAERIGVSRETVANYMRLLRLPKKASDYLLRNQLTFSDARLLLGLESEHDIDKLAEEIVTKHLRRDEIESRLMQLSSPIPIPGAEKPPTGGARWIDPNVRAAQQEMERILGVRVFIKDRQGKGKIVIEYATVDDYERVVEMLRGKTGPASS